MTYLEMVNEVLVRMREDEITSVDDPNNEPQQKLVCKFVSDAHRQVAMAHTWNASRKLWVVDLIAGQPTYKLADTAESAAIYTVRWAGSNTTLKEANQRWLSEYKVKTGTPWYYSTGFVEGNALTLRLHPIPDIGNSAAGPVSEYNMGEYEEAEYNGQPYGDHTTLVVEGYRSPLRLSKDDDRINLPIEPVMYYSLAYSSRERGEVGGQSSVELFSLASNFLSESIAWDVNNSDLEYIWRQV